MKPEDWQQLDQLFHSALERPPSERAAFLDEACGGDKSLHKEVEALLAAHSQAGSFIERSALEVEARSVAADGNQLIAGQKISHYQIVSALGEGGMGEVYLAEDTRLDRHVALKILPAEVVASQENMRRFVQEAKAASSLNHPNIVTIHEIDQVDSLHFIAIEFIDGETLRQQMNARLAQREALEIGIQVASALAAAHKVGIIHRDIKPENIMIRSDGFVKVLDFGLAKLTKHEQAVSIHMQAASRILVKTEPGLVMGTPQYMSPEQARGLEVDERSDIWSLGCVLYEMVIGQPPFTGPTTMDVLSAILNDVPNLYSETPRKLEHIVSKALRKDPEERYQTANELLRDLQDLRHELELQTELKRSLPLATGAGRQHGANTAADELAVARKPSAAPARTTSADQEAEIKRRRLGQIMVVTTLAVLIGTLMYRSYFRPSSTAINSIAVLPLINASNNPEVEYLSDGITESLINSLSRFPQLRVSARATAFHYKGKEIDPQRVGRELGVRALLTGRLIKQGDTLNLQVELVETDKGSQIWGEQYNRKISDLLAVRQELASDITEKLRLRLTGEDEKRLRKGDTGNTEAYHFYLRGRYFWNKRTGDSIRKAIREFQQSIDKDPTYALA